MKAERNSPNSSRHSRLTHSLYLIASLIILTLGLGHLAFELFQNQLLGPPDPEAYTAMLRHHIKVFGFNRSIQEFMHGFSLTMAFFMIAYGGLNLLLVIQARELLFSHPSVCIFNSLFCLLISFVSCLYFHWPPIIFFFIASIFYLIVFFKTRKSSNLYN